MIVQHLAKYSQTTMVYSDVRGLLAMAPHDGSCPWNHSWFSNRMFTLYWVSQAPPVCDWKTSIESPSSISNWKHIVQCATLLLNLHITILNRYRIKCSEPKNDIIALCSIDCTHPGRSVRLVDWIAIKTKPHVLHSHTLKIYQNRLYRTATAELWSSISIESIRSQTAPDVTICRRMFTYRSFTICRHQLSQRCILFYFEVNYWTILAGNFQVDVFCFLQKAHLEMSCLYAICCSEEWTDFALRTCFKWHIHDKKLIQTEWTYYTSQSNSHQKNGSTVYTVPRYVYIGLSIPLLDIAIIGATTFHSF